MQVAEKNKNYIIDITGMTHEGQGVGRIDGLAVFVDGVLEGEQAEIKIIKLNKSYAVGKLINVLKSTPDRATPFCGAYKRCGGCSLQHMDYKAQLEFKTKLVRDNLERIGGLSGVTVHDTIGMTSPMNYRNKAQFPVATADGRVVTGFYAARSHDVIEPEECGIQDVAGDRIRKVVGRFITERGLTAYDEKTGKGLIRHIMTRVGFNTGEVMVVLVINGSSLPYADELVQLLTQTDGSWDSGEGVSGGGGTEYKVRSIYLNINTKNTNVILGDMNILLYGSETITDTIGKYKFIISPHSFFQVNPVQTEVLYGKALEYARLSGTETVFDLYCGIGTISLFLSEKASKVIGVEVVEAAINDACENAKINGVTNTEFFVGEAEKVVPDLYSRGICADVVVLDPPRKGCDESLLQLLADMQPDKIVYVSCNPSTLARDLKFLAGHGFNVIEVQPVDMFPWSGHVESIVLMTNSGSKGK
jgi:23S rRNA (uracil1939-C5)-methyltransferase